MPFKRCYYHCSCSASVFGLPKNAGYREQWLKFIFNTVPDHYNKNTALCSSHFTEDCFHNMRVYNAGFAMRLLLKCGAVPTIKPKAVEPQPHFVDGKPTPAHPDPLPALSCDGGNRPARHLPKLQTVSAPQKRKQLDIMPGDVKKVRVGYDMIKVESLGENTTTEGSTMITEMGTPSHVMLKRDADWDPSVHLKQTEVKATECRGVTGKDAAPAPLLVAVKEEPATPDIGTPSHVMPKCDPGWDPLLHFRQTEIKATECGGVTGENAGPAPLLVSVKEEPATPDIGTPAHAMLKCDPDWDPSLQFGHTEVKATKCGGFTGDEAAPAPLLAVKKEPETAEEGQMEDPGANNNTAEQQECHLCSCRRAEIERLLEENKRLKKELAKKNMEEDSFKDDDAKVKYYTGLPCFMLLMGVLTQLLPSLPQTGQKLSPFQMLLLTMMRLKLNLPIQHIAYLFSVDQNTVSATFRDTIGTMFRYLKPLVHWPQRNCLQAAMPQQFVEAFGNRVSVIVDCVEIHMQSASNLEDGALTVSRQKHQTLKYLFGITPRGSISFISKGWDGCVSDKHVTESSGLLNHLSPGDFVLSDHGFDGVKLMCAELKSGSIQLDAKDEEETRRIAHLRVHVERVIGCVRTKYNILNNIVPANMVLLCQGEDMTFLDKIVTVCCALTNMCPSVVMKP